jgi:hypothetical protein
MIPTRKRQHMLQDLIRSIYSTARDPYRIETLITYDNDDRSTIDALPNLKNISKDYPVKFFSRERHYATSGVYYNEMAEKAIGKYVIAVNDDTIFTKTHWDELGYKKLEEYMLGRPDRIVYGITNDFEVERARNEKNYFSCFPLLSKETIKVMGFFFDPIFPKDGADWDLVMTYRELKRVIDLRNEIEIKHISFRSGRRPHDLLDYDEMTIPGDSHPYAGKNMRRNINFLTDYILNYKENGENVKRPW